MSENTTKIKPVIVDLCGNGCCPKADFSESDKVILSDKGQVIVITKDQAINLARELLERGYLDK